MNMERSGRMSPDTPCSPAAFFAGDFLKLRFVDHYFARNIKGLLPIGVARFRLHSDIQWCFYCNYQQFVPKLFTAALKYDIIKAQEGCAYS